MHFPSLHSFSPGKLAGDIASFFGGFSAASTNTPILGTVKMTLLEVAPNISPEVMDEIVRAGAALVVSFLSRVLFDMWEKIKNRKSNKDEQSKKEHKNSKETGNEEK